MEEIHLIHETEADQEAVSGTTFGTEVDPGPKALENKVLAEPEVSRAVLRATTTNNTITVEVTLHSGRN